MVKFRDTSLSIKLNLLLLFVLGILLLATVLLLAFNTGKLTEEIGSERIAEEVNIMQKRLAEVEKELTVDVSFTASSIPFIQAVGRRNGETVTDLITISNNALNLDDIDVVDGDGHWLADLRPTGSSSLEAFPLLAAALKGETTTGVLVDNSANNTGVVISSAAPVNALRQGTVLGAVQMSQTIDDAFLRDLAFERDGVYLGVVYDNQLLARTTSDAKAESTVLYRDIALDPVSVSQASSGEIVVPKNLITSSNIPYAVAYIPLSVGTGPSPVSMMILVELDEIFAFQNSTLMNTIIVFAALALVALVIIYVSLQHIVIQPLNALRTIAQKMTGGQYKERIPAAGQDEVGQLAASFNEMAGAIEQREENLQAARAQAERANQVKSAFLASMSHELRTPLNGIINFTGFVADEMLGPVNEKQAQFLRDAIVNAEHLLSLINDVLDISKIEAGSLRLFVEANVDLNKEIETVARTGQTLLADKPVDLNIEIEGSLPLLQGDKRRIRQIMLNLVSNACKFTDEGSVTIKAKQCDNEVFISVKDTGPGIEAKDHDAIFETFLQTETGLRKGGGTGLGLPISKKLAEAHGGRLWLESEPGAGAEFFVVLPLQAEISNTPVAS
jgi:signal transduction histidine kinase